MRQSWCCSINRPVASSYTSARSIELLNFQSNVSSVLRSWDGPIAERGELQAPLNQTVSPAIEFVVYEQPEEIKRAEAVCTRLLSTNVHGVSHAAKPQLT